MVSRPQAGNSAATLDSINSLCDAADAAASAIATLQQTLSTVQAANAAEVQARGAAIGVEAQARAAADASETQARNSALNVEAQARAAAILQEQQDRGAAISAAATALGDRITALSDSLQQAIRAEAQARLSADNSEQQARNDAIKAQATALADAINDLTTKISAKANSIDLTDAAAAQSKALVDAVTAQDKALADAVSAIRVVTDAISTTITGQRLDFTTSLGRPGDAPLRYTIVAAASTLGGVRSGLPLVPPALLAGSDNGPVVRLSGSGILATRNAFALEPGRLYRARYVIQRRVNPSDPAGDAVLCGIVYLDQSLRVLDGIVPVRSYPALATAVGRQECEALIARSAGLSAAFQSPPSARFAVPVLATFGPDALTDVEVLDFDDVTSAFVLPVPPDGLEARITDLVAGLAARVQVLESEVGTPSKLTFSARGDAAYAAIPDSVQVVELLGRQYAGDGGAGLFMRVAGAPAAGADTFTSHGAVFQRVQALPDVAAQAMDSGFVAWMAGLPTEPPPTSGARWNDNGVPTVTP